MERTAILSLWKHLCRLLPLKLIFLFMDLTLCRDSPVKYSKRYTPPRSNGRNCSRILIGLFFICWQLQEFNALGSVAEEQTIVDEPLVTKACYEPIDMDGWFNELCVENPWTFPTHAMLYCHFALLKDIYIHNGRESKKRISYAILLAFVDECKVDLWLCGPAEGTLNFQIDI